MDSKIIRIVNLDDKTTEQSLKQFIEQYLSLNLNGVIKSVYVRKDELVNLVFAYVVFEYGFAARVAVERLAGYYYNALFLEVELIGPNLKCKNYSQQHSVIKLGTAQNISLSKWSSSSRTSPHYINTPNQKGSSVTISSNSTFIQSTRRNVGNGWMPANSNSPARNNSPAKQSSSSGFSTNSIPKLMEVTIDKPTRSLRSTFSPDSTSTNSFTNQYVNKPTIRSETVSSNSTANHNVRYPTNRQAVKANTNSPAQNNSPARQSSSSGFSSNSIPKLMQTPIAKLTTSPIPTLSKKSTSTNPFTNQYVKPTIRSETVINSNFTSSQSAIYPTHGQSVPANTNSPAKNNSPARQSSSSGFSSNSIPKLMQATIDKPTTSPIPTLSINARSTNPFTNEYVNKPTITSETVNSNFTSSQSVRYPTYGQSVPANTNSPAQNKSPVRQSSSSGFTPNSIPKLNPIPIDRPTASLRPIPINKPIASPRPTLSTNFISTNTSTNQYVNKPIEKSQTVTSIRPNIALARQAYYETRTSNYNYPGTASSNYSYNPTGLRSSTLTHAPKKKESNCVIS